MCAGSAQGHARAGRGTAVELPVTAILEKKVEAMVLKMQATEAKEMKKKMGGGERIC